MTAHNLVATSFGKQLEGLKYQIRSQWSWPSPEAGFAWFVLNAVEDAVPVPLWSDSLWDSSEPLHYAQSIAAAGYALSLTEGRGNTAGVDSKAWAQGLDRLVLRDAFPADRQSFAFRPFELLGIALGAAACGDTSKEARTWLSGVIERLQREGNSDHWSMALYGAAAHVLGIEWPKVLASDPSVLSADTLALFKWLTVGYAEAPFLEAIVKDIDALDRALLLACGTGDPAVGLDVGRSAVLWYALRRTVSERIQSDLSESWQINRESGDALAIVITLCRRFPLFAKQLQVRRKDVKGGQPRPTIGMKDEYDVQDALHALLRLHFDDVRTEEWTPNYAGGQKRMDFLLKREEIVIEAKMMRSGLSQTKVAAQLGEDKEFYQAHPSCKILVCFVYDPEFLCPNPSALEDDVALARDGFQVHLVVSPRGL